jgi:hypothetical protein
MTDNAEKNPGQKRVNNPDNSNRKIRRMFQRRTPLRKAIRSRAISRGNRTRAASAALPKL